MPQSPHRDPASPDESDIAKREYHAPALEDLGTVAEVTATNSGTPGTVDTGMYAS
jgi:hypothetical protein